MLSPFNSQISELTIKPTFPVPMLDLNDSMTYMLSKAYRDKCCMTSFVLITDGIYGGNSVLSWTQKPCVRQPSPSPPHPNPTRNQYLDFSPPLILSTLTSDSGMQPVYPIWALQSCRLSLTVVTPSPSVEDAGVSPALPLGTPDSFKSGTSTPLRMDYYLPMDYILMTMRQKLSQKIPLSSKDRGQLTVYTNT